MEDQIAEVSGLTLRFGHLYGPGTAYAPDGGFTSMLQSRKLPIVGAGSSVFSLIHTRDAAMAILAALDKNVSGALNIVDDDPVPGNVFLPAFAEMLGAKPPQRLPSWLARPMVGPFGTAFMNDLRGADNARARLTLDWRPGFRSWRDGFRAELGSR
jgi:nucleoside-diphosphate-sugar epimerase